MKPAQSRDHRLGFTMIEMVIVMGLMFLIAVPAVYSLVSARANQALIGAAEELESNVKTAKVYAREDRGESVWGIRVGGPREYALVARSETGVEVTESSYIFDDLVTFDNVSAYPVEVWFARGSGIPNTARTFTLRSITGIVSSVVISDVGFVELQ